MNGLSVRKANGCQQATRSWERGLEQTLRVLRSPQKSSACRHFDLMASGLGENGDALLKLPSLWRFVTAALGR